ncbi:hypothetical protein ACFSTH_05730 [Paenibacillus yanchengensis]|uniref:Uncharacterized protein n=1 Tax=Paenibacillus yanchengensis TaxID=2035833 RepID=A0ABW4YHF7_9BACL
MLILTRFSSNTLIRAAAIVSVLLGLLYLPTNYALPIVGLGSELSGGQQLAEQWAMYAIIGGASIFIGSFILHLAPSITYKRVIITIYLIAMCLLVVAQLLPLFWWLFIAFAVFSWSSVIGFFLHLILLALASWGAIVTMYGFEQLKVNVVK